MLESTRGSSVPVHHLCVPVHLAKKQAVGKVTGTPQMCTGTQVQKIDSSESVPVHH